MKTLNEIRREVSRLYKQYNNAERQEMWLITESFYPDKPSPELTHILTPEEEKHRKIGALTALSKISGFIVE